jgi:hypothetical protein
MAKVKRCPPRPNWRGLTLSTQFSWKVLPAIHFHPSARYQNYRASRDPPSANIQLNRLISPFVIFAGSHIVGWSGGDEIQLLSRAADSASSTANPQLGRYRDFGWVLILFLDESQVMRLIGYPTHRLASRLEVSARIPGHEKAKARLF